jgi:hypothetical protein
MGGIKTISIIVAANIKGLEAGLGKANKSIAGFAANAARIGSTLSFGITAPLTALGTSAFKAFRDFESGMNRVAMVTQASKEEIKLLTSEAKRLGATTVFTATQVSKLQEILGRKGFKTDAIVDMTEAILNLSIAAGEDLNIAANSVASTLNAFNLDASEGARVANTLAQATVNSSIQLNTFTTAFANAGASASAANVDIEELTAMMGVLTDNGIKASRAGTSLNSLFITLKEKGISLSDTLDLVSQGELGLEKATAIAGKRFSKQLLILSKNRDKVKDLTAEYKGNTTAMKTMGDLAKLTADHKIALMESAMNAMQIEMGGLMSEALLPMIRKITELAQAFGNLDVKTKKIILIAGAIAASLGPIILIVGGLGGAFVAGLAVLGPFAVALGVMAIKIAAILFVIDLLIKGFGALATYADENRKAITERFENTAAAIGNFFIKIFNNTVKFLQTTAAKFGIKIFKDFQPSKEFKIIPDAELTKITSITDSFEKFNKKYSKFKSNIVKGVKDAFTFDMGGDDSESKADKKEFVASEFDYQAEYQQYLADVAMAEAATRRFQNATIELGKQISMSFADSFAEVVVSGENLKEGLTNIFVDLLKQIGKMIIKALILAAVFAMIPGMGGLGATQVTGFKEILGTLMGGAFADGGQPPVGKMSLVGERGPELFVPNSKGTIVPNHALGGGSAPIPDVKISGNDLLIVFDRAERRKNRR